MSRADDRQAVIDHALFIAVSNADMARIQQYLAEGANPNVPVDAGRSAFGVALWLGMLDVAADLIKHGADINLQRDDGTGAPVWLAALFRDATKNTTVRTAFCIRHGADFSLPFTYGNRTVTVLEALDELRMVLSQSERAGLKVVRGMVEGELAVATRQRQQQLGTLRRGDNRKFKL